jgi:hypothetical protein
MADNATQAKATQDFVPIKEVRNGIVILKDGSLRALLMASSINLALKSQEEQQAIIGQFQNFLNSLEFTAQFFVQSRDLDIRPYLALLEDRYQKERPDAHPDTRVHGVHQGLYRTRQHYVQELLHRGAL